MPKQPRHPRLNDSAVIDFSTLKRKLQVDEAIAKVEEKSESERWSSAYLAAAEAGPAHLLAFMLQGEVYNEQTVLDTAQRMIAGLIAGGFVVVRKAELEVLIGDTVRMVREQAEAEEASAKSTVVTDDDGSPD